MHEGFNSRSSLRVILKSQSLNDMQNNCTSYPAHREASVLNDMQKNPTSYPAHREASVLNSELNICIFKSKA